MNNANVFVLLVAVFFSVIPQPAGNGLNDKYFVTSF